MTNLEHLKLGSHSLTVVAPTTELPISKTLYEILKDFIDDDREKLILQITEVKSINAIICFISRELGSDEPCGFNFLLHNDDQIELILPEKD